MLKKIPVFLFLLCNLALAPLALAQDTPEKITAENGNRLVQMMRLGRGTVDSLAFSPDGSTIAVASSIGTWLYSAENLGTTEEPPLLVSNTPVTAIAYSPDGSVLAAAEEGFVRLWNTADNTEITAFTSNYRSDSLAFSPDGTLLAVGDGSYDITVWDVANKSQVRVQEGHSSSIYALAFSPDGSVLASGSGDSSVRLWDMTSGAELMSLNNHTSYVNSVAFSPDGAALISVSDDDSIRLWDAAEGTEKLVINEFKDVDGEDVSYKENMNSVAFAPDGSAFAVGSDDDMVRVYDLEGTQLAIMDTDHDVESLAFSPDGSAIATIGYDTSVGLWEVASGEKLAEAVGHTDDFNAVSFSPDGSALIMSNSDGNAWLWELASPQEITALPKISEELSFSTENTIGLAYAPDGSYIAFVDGFDVQIWEPDFSAVRTVLSGEGLSFSLAISPDSSLLVFAGSQGVFLFDVATGTLLRQVMNHTDWIRTVAWSPNQNLIATGASDGTVRIWMIGDEPAAATETTQLTCGDNSLNFNTAPGKEHVVACPAGCSNNPIWGTDIYTADSSVCTAAVHAGIIPVSGGSFILVVEEGQTSYAASSQNGITSSEWGSYDSSFSFKPLDE